MWKKAVERERRSAEIAHRLQQSSSAAAAAVKEEEGEGKAAAAGDVERRTARFEEMLRVPREERTASSGGRSSTAPPRRWRRRAVLRTRCPASPVPAFHAAAGAGTAAEAGGDRDPGRIREWPGFPYGSRGVGSGIPAAAGDGDGDRGGERYGLIGAREVCLKVTSTLSCERIIFSIFFTTFLTVAGMIIELKRTIPF